MTEIWGHCGEGGEGWGLSSTLFIKIVKYMHIVSRKTPLCVEIETKKRVLKFLANTFSDVQQHPWEKNQSILSNSPFPCPFLRSSQVKE